MNMEWISVKDRLPPRMKVLDEPLSISGNKVPPLNVSIKVLRITSYDVSVGSVEWFDHGWVNSTHWMPLPPKPIAQEEIDIMTSCDCGGNCPDCVEALKQLPPK
jgi:hypothetical protein